MRIRKPSEREVDLILCALALNDPPLMERVRVIHDLRCKGVSREVIAARLSRRWMAELAQYIE